MIIKTQLDFTSGLLVGCVTPQIVRGDILFLNASFESPDDNLFLAGIDYA